MNDKKKIAILVGDGMADFPVESLQNRTPLEAANTPNMDFLARNGTLGLTRTVPPGMSPGSDTANLSIFGYDPKKYYTGRAPLEAINMGIELGVKDVAFRCNIVTLTDGIMEDFSGHHIDSELSRIIMEQMKIQAPDENIEYYAGVSYRNIIVWRNYPYDDLPGTTPPHDIQDKEAGPHMPSGNGGDVLNRIMEKSIKIISETGEITAASQKYQGKPVSLWVWGGGRRPSMDTLQNRFGLHGYTISAVDLIHGIGRAAGLEPWFVEGATGYIDTNYRGKADGLMKAMERANFVYLHVESPDESGHQGRLDYKLQSIEDFDSMVVGPVVNMLNRFDDFTVLVMPDHPTPLSIKTHTDDPVPFCVYSRNRTPDPDASGLTFTERSASSTGLLVDEAHTLLEKIVHNKI
ncbi:MAG: cofactor-independent phosphoglycerate mutase [Spirochaetota bacterium]